VSWAYIPVYICSLYELNIGVICVSLPCFPAIFRIENMKNLMSVRSWSLFKSFSTSSSRVCKRSTDNGGYSNMMSLKEDKRDAPSVTETSIELRDTARVYHTQEHV
jgi:hypothetical protein